MKISIKNVRIAHKGFNAQTGYHVLINEGTLSRISEQALEEKSDLEVDGSGCWLSAGWCDMRASYCDPGLEHKEDLESGAMAAADGGFTAVALLPNTSPVIDSKKGIRYIHAGNAGRLTQLYPLGAVSVGAAGEELSEMIDLWQAGALGFTDGTHPITNTSLILKALQYLQLFGGVLMNQPVEAQLVRGGQMHEGINSTLLGMKGMPALAEEMAIERDIRLLRYAGGRMHFSCISTAGGVDLIRQAKEEGLQVSCDVAVHQLLFTDAALHDFDTNYKVNPPLRGEDHRQALIRGIKEGTIDAIVSDHQPQDTESKKLEFDLADFGIVSQQTAFAALLRIKELDVNLMVEKLAHAPRRILGLPGIELKEGAEANLTLFSTDYEWAFTEETNFSKSNNSPFFQQQLKGRALGTVANNRHRFHEHIIKAHG